MLTMFLLGCTNLVGAVNDLMSLFSHNVVANELIFALKAPLLIAGGSSHLNVLYDSLCFLFASCFPKQNNNYNTNIAGSKAPRSLIMAPSCPQDPFGTVLLGVMQACVSWSTWCSSGSWAISKQTRAVFTFRINSS